MVAGEARREGWQSWMGGDLVIDHDVVRLDVAVHDAVRVAMLEGLPRAARVRGWAPP